MASLHPGVRRFVSKFACEIVPAGLASAVGAVIFAQQWFGPTPVAQVAATAERLAVQNREIAQMIHDEHAMMSEFLRLEQEREAARQPLTLREVRALADAERAAKEAARRAAEAAKLAPRAKPAESAVAAARVPEYVPAPPVIPPAPQAVAAAEPRRSRGTLDAIVETTGDWANKAVEVTRVREAAAVVRDIPSWLLSIPDRVMGPSAEADKPTRFAAR